VGIEVAQIPVTPCMLLQLFGVSHMKFGAAAEFKSSINTQSVTEQVVGFALTTLEHLAGLFVMSVKKTKGLCSEVYGWLELVSQPLAGAWFSM